LQLGFECRACDEIIKKERGCDDKGIVPFEINGERFFRCPLKLVTRQSWEYINAHRFYKLGLLPNGNRFIDESQKYIDAMTILDNEYSKIEQEQIEKMRK
jgi:hypothetical protein